MRVFVCVKNGQHALFPSGRQLGTSVKRGGGADPDNVAANRKCRFPSHLFKLTNHSAAFGLKTKLS